MVGIIIVFIIAVVVLAYRSGRKKAVSDYKLPYNAKAILADKVVFYKKLGDADKLVFEERIRDFLGSVVIRGVDTDVTDEDRILVASGAIMLIFSFPDWRYNNLDEVLLYKNYFNFNYNTDGPDRNIGGMVGDGAMNGKMILSRPALRASFEDFPNGRNTIIHEFAHLIDKADGYVDGVPEYLLTRPQVTPWIDTMRKQIMQMRRDNRTDIDDYGATNEGEFFAVISEYFFERPEKLRERHPELYTMLSEMFKPQTHKGASPS